MAPRLLETAHSTCLCCSSFRRLAVAGGRASCEHTRRLPRRVVGGADSVRLRLERIAGLAADTVATAVWPSVGWE